VKHFTETGGRAAILEILSRREVPPTELAMSSTLLHLSSETTSCLPVASDFEVYAGRNTVTLAVTVEAADGLPTVVFIPLQKQHVADLASALTAALAGAIGFVTSCEEA
jgi:hypothetical protein